MSRPATWLAIAAVVVALPFLLGGYDLHLLIMAVIFVILASSLGLIVGQAGLLSLGHAAFFGIGAYTSALVYMKLGMPMWGGMLAAAAVAGLCAFLLGALVLRVRGHRFVITTVAFAEITRILAVNWTELTRGQMGLPGILAPTLTIPGIGTIDFGSKIAYYFLAVIVAALSVAVLARLARSPMGWAFAALRENEHLCESLGISAYRYAITAFVAGGLFAGVAGSLYAHYINFVSPDLFLFSYTTIMLVMVVLGGKGTVIGPIIGALVFTVLPEYLRIADKFRLIFFGSILLLSILAFPRGLVELWEMAVALVRRPRAAPVERSADA